MKIRYATAGQRRPAFAGAAAVLSVVALFAVLAHSGQTAWRPLGASTLSPDSQPSHYFGNQKCRHWAATYMLSGACLAEVNAGTGTLPCCGGEGYKCKPCPEAKQQALQCVSPRHLLLYAVPGCNIGGGAHGQGSSSSICRRLSTADVLAGRWINASSLASNLARSSSMTAPPPLLFQPGGQQGQRKAVLTSNETLQRLWAAGFDRVVIAGDSTVRQFYNRLVSLLRQQDIVIDGGNMAHAHYKLQVWHGSGPGAPYHSTSSSSTSSSTGGGSTIGSTSTALGSNCSGSTGSFATDGIWLSPTANYIKGTWKEKMMLVGIQELVRRSFGGSNSSGSGSGNGSSDSSSRDMGSGIGRSLTLDFLVGSRADWQQLHVRRYFAGGPPADVRGSSSEADWRRRTLLVLSLCVWEQQVVFRSGWLDFVEEMRAQLGQLVLLTCPLDRLRHSFGQAVVAERNQRLREMVFGRSSSGTVSTASGSSNGREQASIGSSSTSASLNRGGSGGGSGGGNGTQTGRPPLLVDLDAMTQQLPPGSQLGIAPKDYHYQCMLSTSKAYDSGPIQWSGGDGTAHPWYPVMRYNRLLVPPAGTCTDPVNFAGWEMLLSQLCPRG